MFHRCSLTCVACRIHESLTSLLRNPLRGWLMICDYPWEWHLNWYSFPRRNRSNFFCLPSIISDIVQVAAIMLLHSIIYAHWNVHYNGMRRICHTYIRFKKVSRYLHYIIFTRILMQYWKILQKKNASVICCEGTRQLIASEGNKLTSCGNKGRCLYIVKTEVLPIVMHRRKEMHNTREIQEGWNLTWSSASSRSLGVSF